MTTKTKPSKPFKHYRFDRMEIAGSLGDLGTLLPLAVGMIVLRGVYATNVLIMVGLFYIIAGVYFRVPIAVQPMKAIAAYAIAVGLTTEQIASSCLWMGIFLLFLGITGLIEIIRKYVPISTIRGLQLSLGIVLLTKGLGLMVATDPNLKVQSVGPIPMGLLLGVLGLVLTFILVNNKKLPAALLIIILGLAAGLLIGKPVDTSQFSLGVHLPEPLPYGWPNWNDFLYVLPAVVLPQLPLTIGNAIISNTDLSHQYFQKQAIRVTNRRSAISQGLANLASFFMGGIPMCHGAGGLAAHYRFGARTGGSNLIIGTVFVVLALILGEGLVGVLKLLPLSILGVLLVFAGLQLALMIQDLNDRKDLFTALLMLGLALVFNLGVAFLAGIVVAYAAKNHRIQV